MGKLGSETQLRRLLGVYPGKLVDELGDEGHFVTVVHIKAPDGVAGGLVAKVVFLRQWLLMQVHDRASNVEVFIHLIVQVQPQHPLGGHAEGVILRTHTDGSARSQNTLVDDTHRTHGVVDRVVNILYQWHSSGGNGDATLRDAVAKGDLAAHGTGVVALQVEAVPVGILLRQTLGHGVERVKAVAVSIVIVTQYSPQIATKRLNIWEENTPRTALYESPLISRRVKPVEHTVGIVIALRSIHAVHPEKLDERDTLLGTVGEKADANATLIALVKHIETEIVATELATLEEVDILHHELPQRTMGVYGGTLKQLDDECAGVVDAIRRQLTNLVHIGIAHHLVLESNGEHLVIAERLVQGNEAQLRIEGVLVAVEQPRTLHLLVVDASRKTQALHVAGDGVDTTHAAATYNLQHVVGGIAGHHGSHSVKAKVGRHTLAKVCQGKNVAVLRDSSTHIRTPHLNTQYAHVAVHHRQRTHSPIVVVVEVLRDEVVSIVLVLVGAYLELMAAGTTLHLHILRAGLLLTEHSINGQSAKFQLGVETPQLLAAFDKIGAQRKRHIGCFEQLQDIVLLALIAQHLFVLKVEGGLRVVADVKSDKVAYLGTDIGLYLLVKVEGGDATLILVALRIVTVVVYDLEGEFRTARRGNLDLRLAHHGLQLRTDTTETRYLAQQTTITTVKHRPLALLVPVLRHQLVHLPVLVVVKGHILPAHHHITYPSDTHIVTTLSIILHGGLQHRRAIPTAHRPIHTVVLTVCHRHREQNTYKEYQPF